jgi:hypothetical protein
MQPQQIYQPIVGMVIGFSILSYLLQQPIIAYIVLATAFISLVSERVGGLLVRTVHAIISFVFGWLLKAILATIYFLLLTPIALFRKKQPKEDGWQPVKAAGESQMKYTW